jgi:hypothetical protein
MTNRAPCSPPLSGMIAERSESSAGECLIEPQFTVYHNGTGLPSFQLFSGLNFQFRKKTD